MINSCMNVLIGNGDCQLISGPVGKLQVELWHPENAIPKRPGLYAVVCHPNPQRGGNMHNPVVTALANAYLNLGIPIVRFNYRGVGKSQGDYDGGVGERGDLQAIVEWANREMPGRDLLLAGYSFGATIAAKSAHQQHNLLHLALVSPIVKRLEEFKGKLFPAPVTVFHGGRDHISTPEFSACWVDSLRSPAHFVCFQRATHFYINELDLLTAELSQCLMTQLEL